MAEIYTSGVKDEALSNWFAGRLTEAGLAESRAAIRP